MPDTADNRWSHPAVILVATWHIAFGESWWFVVYIVLFLVFILVMEKVQTTACPVCDRLLRNPEWNSPLLYCYKCGARLQQSQANTDVVARG